MSLSQIRNTCNPSMNMTRMRRISGPRRFSVSLNSGKLDSDAPANVSKTSKLIVPRAARAPIVSTNHPLPPPRTLSKDCQGSRSNEE